MNRIKNFRFRNFQIYKDAIQAVGELKEATKKEFPKDEQFSLTSQLWRAADSIVLNVAEGADRGTDRDFAHFLNISLTSLNEVVACLDLAKQYEYISNIEHDSFLEKFSKLADQLTAFRRSLLKNPTK